ncbi:MAG: hypothetical protein QXE80_09160 [Pyrobaculum sp.]
MQKIYEGGNYQIVLEVLEWTQGSCGLNHRAFVFAFKDILLNGRPIEWDVIEVGKPLYKFEDANKIKRFKRGQYYIATYGMDSVHFLTAQFELFVVDTINGIKYRIVGERMEIELFD